jgi:histone H1/5
LGAELEGYAISKGTIRFPLTEPVPVRLLTRIAKVRAKAVAERVQAKAKPKASPKPKAKASPKPKAKASPKPKAKASPKPKAKASPPDRLA